MTDFNQFDYQWQADLKLMEELELAQANLSLCRTCNHPCRQWATKDGVTYCTACGTEKGLWD